MRKWWRKKELTCSKDRLVTQQSLELYQRRMSSTFDKRVQHPPFQKRWSGSSCTEPYEFRYEEGKLELNGKACSSSKSLIKQDIYVTGSYILPMLVLKKYYPWNRWTSTRDFELTMTTSLKTQPKLLLARTSTNCAWHISFLAALS